MLPFSPCRAGHWRVRERTLPCPARPLLMGIVNVTPDSFSDGGRFFDASAAVAHGVELAEHGADLLDIGGESTRLYAQPVPADEELRRVAPVIERLAREVAIPLSIDTSKAVVAREAIDAGAAIINDTTGLADPAMIETAAETGAGVCVMHMRGTPRSMQDAPAYSDVVAEVGAFLRQRRDTLVSQGIALDCIALDPGIGIGFGKTAEHNLELLRHAAELHALGCPVLVGHSRKQFIGQVLGDPRTDRLAGTIGAALALARSGVQILRVHDVEPVAHALALFAAAGGLEP
ncbi:MAG: dihydropteroate synthase [Thermoguttaceae bacterium]|jgi:dihydropteroate synthase